MPITPSLKLVNTMTRPQALPASPPVPAPCRSGCAGVQHIRHAESALGSKQGGAVPGLDVRDQKRAADRLANQSAS